MRDLIFFQNLTNKIIKKYKQQLFYEEKNSI